jgi:hypothetical protein
MEEGAQILPLLLHLTMPPSLAKVGLGGYPPLNFVRALLCYEHSSSHPPPPLFSPPPHYPSSLLSFPQTGFPLSTLSKGEMRRGREEGLGGEERGGGEMGDEGRRG